MNVTAILNENRFNTLNTYTSGVTLFKLVVCSVDLDTVCL